MKAFTQAVVAATAVLTSPELATAQTAAHDQAAPSEVPSQQPASEPGAASEIPQSDIVVTALKRTTSVQNTPATVEVLGGETLRSAAINSIQQIGQIAPSVSIQRPPNNTASATIRGLGTTSGPVSFDQGVALFVDGVYAARGADFLSSLFDLDRVEIVKGTQAAVLGKNTSLGAISLTTRKPGNEFAADALVSYEFERNSTVVSGGVDIPITDTLAVRAAGQYQHLGGLLTNRFVGPGAEKSALQTQEAAGRLTLAWRPDSRFTLTANYTHQKLENLGIPVELYVGSPGAQALFVASGFGSLYESNLDYKYASNGNNGPSKLRQNSDRATATASYDLGSATLTSITGWSAFDQRRHLDYDQTPGTYFTDDATIAGRQVSEEVRIASDGSPKLGYLAGVLYLHNTIRQNIAESAAYPTGFSGAFRSSFFQQTDTYSGFGQLNYRIHPKVALTAGLRVTNEAKQADLSRTTVTPGAFSSFVYPPYPLTRLSRSETVVDGSGTIEYHPVDRALLYVSYGQGTKGGGFTDTAQPTNAEYRKEVARTFEAGFKVEGPGRAWHLNVAGFRTDVKDFQNNLFDGARFIVQNLDISSTGAEVEAIWRATPELSFDVQGTYAYTVNKSAPTTQLDRRLPQSPRLSGRVGATFEHEVADEVKLHVAGDLSYRSRISLQLNPSAVPFGAAYPRLNASVGIRGPRSRWDLSLIGRNLNNARSVAFGFPAPFVAGAAYATPEENRTVTLQLRVNY